MPIEYDTDEGKVRLLIADTDENHLIFADAQITGFLAIARNGSVKRAAADALDAIATSEALIGKVIKTQDLQTDGAKLADALRKHAAELRRQADDDDDTDGGASFFDILPGPRRRSYTGELDEIAWSWSL